MSESSIQLDEHNAYANGRIIVFDDGTEELVREPLVWEPDNDDDFHTVKAGDYLDALANHYYTDKVENPERYYWVIADANEIENPLDLSELVGELIVIPNILNVKLKLKT